MKYLPLVLSALWRRPAETVFTFLAVTAGFVLFASMMGLNVTWQRAIDEVQADRLIVINRFPTTLGGLPIALEEQLRKLPGVASVGAFASVCGRYGAEQNSTCVFTADEGMRAAFPFPIEAAQWQRLMGRPDGILISRKAAQNLQLREGDVLTLTVGAGVRADGSHSWPFKVIGVVPGESPEWPHGFRVGNLNYFRNNRPPPAQGQIGAYRLGLTDANHVSEVARNIDRSFANSGTPTSSLPARQDSVNAERSVVDMALLTRLVAAAGLFMILYLTANTIARAVRERTAELGVLQALGFTPGQLIGLMSAEAIIPCVLGAVVGTAAARMLAGAPGHWLPSAVPIPEATVSADVFAQAMAAAALLAVFSSALPILRVWRQRPAELIAS